MNRLIRTHVNLWLEHQDAHRMYEIATRRGVDLPTLIADTLEPLLAAEEQGARMFTVALDHDDVRRLREIITRLCSEEPEPVDADAEIGKWLQVYVNTGLDDEYATL